jgi:tRNA threonylcarbamoyladenosine biosynthesis protein TsaB
MNLLAIDTSASSMTLGVRTATDDIYREIASGRKHSRDILPSILSILAESGIGMKQLDALAFAKGPGSFTGLRIAVGVVQGLGYGLSIPVVPISNLAAIARKLGREQGCDNVLVALTARGQEVFMGAYTQCTDVCPTLMGQEVVADCDHFPGLPAGLWHGVGDNEQFFDDLVRLHGQHFETLSSVSQASAVDLLDMAVQRMKVSDTVDALTAEPEYIRHQVTSPPRQ